MLGELPASLQLQLALVLNRMLFTHVPIFKSMETKCVIAFVQHLRPLVCLPNQLVVKANTKAPALFFVNRGRLAVLNQAGLQLDTLVDNDFFGESSLINDSLCVLAVRALEYCDLMCLHKGDFERVLLRFPDLRESVLEHAEMAREEREARAEEQRMAQQQTMQRKKSFAGGALAGAGAAAAAAGGRRFSAGGRRGSETGGRVRRPSMENALASFKEGRRRISLSGRNLKPELVAASQAVPGLACGASDPAILAPNAYTSPRAEPKGREGRGSVSFGCTHNQIAPE